jgi:hypothetical protein
MGCCSNLLPLPAIWQQDFARRKSLVLRLPQFRHIDVRLRNTPCLGRFERYRLTGPVWKRYSAANITPNGVYFANRTMPAFVLPEPVEA